MEFQVAIDVDVREKGEITVGDSEDTGHSGGGQALTWSDRQTTQRERSR